MPEQLFGVLAGWQYNSRTVAYWGKGTKPADRDKRRVHISSAQSSCEVSRLSASFETTVREGGGEASAKRHPASVWLEPLGNLTFRKWAIWIKSNQRITFHLNLAPNFKDKTKQKIKSQSYKNGIKKCTLSLHLTKDSWNVAVQTRLHTPTLVALNAFIVCLLTMVLRRRGSLGIKLKQN